MDCNKDEAARAKALAERKMLDKDFVGAKKLIIKAQQLSKEVGDNDSAKMLTVCDVHCAAGAKEDGQIDWYAILQVPETADEALIKKQYRKLALLLHPDKNKFEGAEKAFKLVGQANETLTERVRATQEMERVKASQTTFWTTCPCGGKYEYPISALGKALFCQFCLKQFIARESSRSKTSSDDEEETVSESSTSEASSDDEKETVSESITSETSSDEKEENVSESITSETSSYSESLSLDMEEDIPSTSSAQESILFAILRRL